MPSTATPLTAEQTQQLRTQLLQRQKQLLQELDEVKRATLAQIPTQGDAGHPDDRKEHTEGMFFNRVRDAEAARLSAAADSYTALSIRNGTRSVKRSS